MIKSLTVCEAILSSTCSNQLLRIIFFLVVLLPIILFFCLVYT